MSSPTPTSPTPSQAHVLVSADFTDRVRGVTDWDAATPVPEWTARDVVRHLTDWLPGLLAAGSDLRLPQAPSVDEDPVARWLAHTEAVQGLLDDPEAAATVVKNPAFGEPALAAMLEQFYVPDVFMHTWDLARASGQPDRLDAGFAATLLTGMESIEPMLRASGQFGTRQAIREGADATDRLMAFVGRDPYWRRSS
ncbi:MAG: TIGR03086 family metal-binding protein [Actinomycetales bacterium]